MIGLQPKGNLNQVESVKMIYNHRVDRKIEPFIMKEKLKKTTQTLRFTHFNIFK